MRDRRLERRAATAAIAMVLLTSGSAQGDSAAAGNTTSPQWHAGPTRIGLRVLHATIDVPAGYSYICDKVDIDPYCRENGNDANTTLAVIQANDGASIILVQEAPVGELAGNPLRNGAADYLAGMQRYFDQLPAASAAAKIHIDGWAESPAFQDGAIRVLHLAFHLTAGDGEQGLMLLEIKANAKACLRFVAFTPVADLAAAEATLKPLADSLTLPPAPAPAVVSAPPPAQSRGVFATVGDWIKSCWSRGGPVLAVFGALAGAFSKQAPTKKTSKTSSSVTVLRSGPAAIVEPPPFDPEKF